MTQRRVYENVAVLHLDVDSMLVRFSQMRQRNTRTKWISHLLVDDGVVNESTE